MKKPLSARQIERREKSERMPYVQVGIGGELWLKFQAGDESRIEVAVRPELNGFKPDPKFKDYWTQNHFYIDIIELAKLTAALAVADHIWMLGTCAGQSGARIVEEYSMIERGLAYHDDVIRMPEFAETVRELSDRFNTL